MEKNKDNQVGKMRPKTVQQTISKIVLSPNNLSEDTIFAFQQIIYDYFKQHKRFFPWRETWDPYAIMVSEYMLQQTQTQRVIEKYTKFLHQFPTIQDLAYAPLKTVLEQWSGLGYNRRALALKKAADKISREYHGNVPDDMDSLQSLPGVGSYTAAAICVFAFNKPIILIETNIRAVYIHFFFQTQLKVHDKDLLPVVERTLDRIHPRDWYYALMDYGVMVKKRFSNPNQRSVHHQKQAPFVGSRRELRGKILRILLLRSCCSKKEFMNILDVDEVLLGEILNILVSEGLIGVCDDEYFVT
ncbi:MAG: A/G-specific adenine glycosylase [Candidatus Thermoplasmatota archaeon]|nr:A/G-specific adenine glycosylase [Candidatus Thermoplasmatota archaeon]MBU1940809.1 A/G-specific adenine glycosylase [Candidatus Thermoplasmatota archaeon]